MGIHIDGLVTLALQLQHAQVTLVEIVKAGLLRGFHDKLLCSEGPELGHAKKFTLKLVLVKIVS